MIRSRFSTRGLSCVAAFLLSLTPAWAQVLPQPPLTTYEQTLLQTFSSLLVQTQQLSFRLDAAIAEIARLQKELEATKQAPK